MTDSAVSSPVLLSMNSRPGKRARKALQKVKSFMSSVITAGNTKYVPGGPAEANPIGFCYSRSLLWHSLALEWLG